MFLNALKLSSLIFEPRFFLENEPQISRMPIQKFNIEKEIIKKRLKWAVCQKQWINILYGSNMLNFGTGKIFLGCV